MRMLYTAEEIAERIAQLGEQITSAYKGRELLIVGILKGSFMFVSDLVRNIDLPVKIEFARLSSYQNTDCPVCDVQILDDVHDSIKDKHVLIVDDIMDTGRSMESYKKHLLEKGAASINICTMIDKTIRREASITPDYFGFRITDGFIVGYGLDFAENYRTLPQLYELEPQN